MLRWFPRFQVATSCFSCSPPDLNLVVTNFMFCLYVKSPLPPGDNPIAVYKYYYYYYYVGSEELCFFSRQGHEIFMFFPQNPQTGSGTSSVPRNALSRGKTDGACTLPLPFGKDERSYVFTASCAFTTCPVIVLSYKTGPYISSDCYTFQFFV